MEYRDLEPAKATRESVSHLWNNNQYIAEKKEDGHRYLMHFGGDCKRIYMVSRRDEEIGKSVFQFSPQIDISGLGYTVLDGEIVPPEGNEFHDVASYTRVEPSVSQLRRKQGEIKYKVFDILFINSQDVRNLPLEKRLELLEGVLANIFPNHPFVLPVKRAYKDTYQFFLEQVMAGGEGAILKDLKASYGNNWIKAKRVSSFDVIITGIAAGYNTPHGKIFMSVCDGLTLRPVGKCGIQIENVRNEMNRNPNAFIGQVIEVLGLKVDPSNGVIREPRFVRMRPDLKPTDATWEKLQRDAMKIEID